MAVLTDEVRALLERRNFAHLATLMPDGSPHSIAVWVLLDGEEILLGTADRTRKARNIARDGRVALSITDHEHPYRTAVIRGRASIRADEDHVVMNRLARKYTGADFPFPGGPGRIAIAITPEHATYMELPFSYTPG